MSSPPRSPGEEPLFKKKKKSSPVLPQQTPQKSTPFSSLPDDLLMTCCARISRLHYPALSFVSKRFRALLYSPELHKTRSLLGRSEIWLYVCFKFSYNTNPNPSPRWFILCPNPNQKKEKMSSGKLLVPIPGPNPSKAYPGRVVSLGSSIYSIGGPSNGSPSSDVWVLDCHCHAWRKATSMRVKRAYHAAANVFDGKIYVAGGCKTCNSSSWICKDCKSSSSWMEVFDPKTQTWEPVLCSLLAERRSSRVIYSAVIEGKIYYMFGAETLAYDPNEDKWEAIEGMAPLDLEKDWHSYLVIDNVLYCYSKNSGEIKWYDTKSHYWVYMTGLEGLPTLSSCSSIELADYGGKLAVLWTRYFLSEETGYEGTRVSCAVVVLERRGEENIWGTVEWLDTAVTVPDFYRLECALAHTV